MRRAAVVGLLTVSIAVATPGSMEGPGVRVAGQSLVIQLPGRPPVLCSGAVLTSMPPSCDGVPLRRVDIRDLPGVQSGAGTWFTRDSVRVIGRYDGRSLTVEEVTAPVGRRTDRAYNFSPPCPAPTGGWAPFSPSVEMRLRPLIIRYTQSHRETDGGSYYDQATGVTTVRFTSDVEKHRAALERIAPRRVCVAGAVRPYVRLLRIQRDFRSDTGIAWLNEHAIDVTGSGIDILASRVELNVVIGGARRQRALDRRYGAGVVVIKHPTLTPL